MENMPTVDRRRLEESGAIEITGKIMLVAVLVLFFVVVFVFFLHLYAKWFRNRRQEEESDATNTRRRRRRFDFAPGYQDMNVVTRKGLDQSVLKAIPVVMFSAKDFKDGLECAVCLGELSEGEKARLLPNCNHGFHVECIDMWFQSHSTCPLCRNSVSPDPELKLESIIQVPSQENSTNLFPTNVLFWGDETQVSTLGEGHQGRHSNASQPPPDASSSSSLSIDIPKHIPEDEEPKSPVPLSRLRSLKRLLSRDRMRISPRRSPRDFDVEQQQGGGRGQS